MTSFTQTATGSLRERQHVHSLRSMPCSQDFALMVVPEASPSEQFHWWVLRGSSLRQMTRQSHQRLRPKFIDPHFLVFIVSLDVLPHEWGVSGRSKARSALFCLTPTASQTLPKPHFWEAAVLGSARHIGIS